MSKLILKILINMAALYAAFFLLGGRGLNIQDGSWLSLLWLAVIFGLVNAFIRPFLMVVGCPFIVATLVYLTSPQYMMILFTDPRGHLIMGASAVWMSIGILVMRNMVNFEI